MRPHQALGYLTPDAFLSALATATTGRSGGVVADDGLAVSGETAGFSQRRVEARISSSRTFQFTTIAEMETR